MTEDPRSELVPLSQAVPGWQGQLTREAVERTTRGVELEQARLRGNRFLVVVRIYHLDYEGLTEAIEIASGHTELNEALAQAQAVGAVRLVSKGRELDPERAWKHAPPKATWPKVPPRWQGRALPVFRDRLWDGVGWNALEVAVAVIPTDPDTPINADVVNTVDMMWELVFWFEKVAMSAPSAPP